MMMKMIKLKKKNLYKNIFKNKYKYKILLYKK